MNETEFQSAPLPNARPKTTTVVGLLIGLAATISYLASYALANAMVAAELVRPWSKDHDPRPKWFAIGFVILMTLFAAMGAAARHASTLQMKKIEEMEQE